MKYFSLIFTAVFVVAFGTAFSQNQGCGTEVTQEVIEWERSHDVEAYRALLNRYMNRDLRTKREYRIQVHIVTKDDGSGGIDAKLVKKEIQSYVNPHFGEMNVSFIACGPINYISSDAYYELSSFSEGHLMASDHNVDSLINIYYVGDADGYGGWATYPVALPIDYIVMSNLAAGDHSSLTHELGHYFSLHHTHEEQLGKENVTRDDSDPCYNCYSSGDLLCDTEADPYLVGVVDFWCQYTGSQMDACGRTYVPDPKNFMSYSFAHCKNVFSPEQESRMLATMATTRAYLNTSPCCALPKVVCKNVSASLNGDGVVTITPEEVDGGSEWDCGRYFWSVRPNIFDCSDIGSNTVTLSLVDSSRNAASCLAVVNIQDTLPPAIYCSNEEVHLDHDGEAVITEDLVNKGSYDPCGIANLTIEPSEFDCNDLGTQSVILTVQDSAGNEDECMSLITVKDNVNPVFSCNAETFWPNPVRNVLNIVLNRIGYKGNVQVEIYDLLGRLSESETLKMEGRLLQQMDLSHLPTGQYVLRIYLAITDEVILEKFIVNR